MLAWHRRDPGEEVSVSFLDSPCGKWVVRWVPAGLCGILSERPSGLETVFADILPIWLERAWDLFWQGQRPQVTYCFDRPVPEFTRQVYEIVSGIPFGESMTYGQVALAAGNSKAARGVGSVMRANPWALFVPCHRVIGSDGSLRGYGGPKGISLKKRILVYEKMNRKNIIE
ncbi:MAG: methylated-DNA--[protein]-cysteine S-methyltransferase [Thermovirgaceae bacterium]|nr:methylated-DNA--[protein]-cysteine S-methyltransferase [Thermovirgaceae bacterium]